MQSRFSSHTIAEIFRDLYLSERSGVLSLTREDDEKRVFFCRGLIHYAESRNEEEDLGPRLVAERKLSPGALDEAQRSIRDTRELAQSLINRGLIGKQSLSDTVRSILESVVESVFTWDGGSARFTDSDALPEVFESDVLITFEVILRGIFSMTQFDPLRDAMYSLDNRLRIRKPSPIPVERLTLSPSHGFILSRVDGTTTVKEVMSLLPQAEEDLALKFLFGLLIMGVLELDPPLGEGPFRVANILRDHADSQALERIQEQTLRQAELQMRSQTPYEVLSVSTDASLQEIERAYEQAKATFSRDRLLPKVREQFRSELALIESRLIEAYLTLARPDQHRDPAPPQAAADAGLNAEDLLVRVDLDKTKGKLAIEESERVSEKYFNKANKAMREGDFHNAIQYGKLAISYNDRDARLYYMLADCQVRNPEARWQRMAEANFAKATELDPWNVDYWISLGRFYKKRGLKLRARKQFEEALNLVPEHEIAARELASLR